MPKRHDIINDELQVPCPLQTIVVIIVRLTKRI